ncbi:MAG: Xaa-Pro peptidase family protein [Nitrospirota bacterium]
MRKSIIRKGIDGFLITSLRNIRYLTGFKGSSAYILITKSRNIFVTDSRYKEEAEGNIKGWDIVIEKGRRLRTLMALVKNVGIRNLGFESTVSYEFFEGISKSGITLKPLRGAVERLRVVKDAGEVRLIGEAVERAEKALLDIKPYIREASRERAIALMLEERLKKRGCNNIPFDIIVASGINSAMPHARASEKRLAAGDLVVIDWGGEAGGYFSDITRTFLIKGGKEIRRKKEIYSTVLKANREAVAAVKHGIATKAIDEAARAVIRSSGYGRFFGHGTGHGVGLEVHELPRISGASAEMLRSNMVFTIEPAIYMPGLGGVRVEDMILVTEETPYVMTKLPKRLEII